MIRINITCDKFGCTNSAECRARDTSDIFTALNRNGFEFVTRPDSKKELLLCKQCRESLEDVEIGLQEERKAAFSEFFEGSKDK